MADDTVQIRFGAETSGVAAGATAVKTQLASLHGAVSDLASGFKTLGGTAVTGFSATASGAKGAASALEQLVKSAKQMGEGGEKIRHTAQAFGTSVVAVQQLGAAFTLMGVDADRGVQGVGQLDRAFATAREGGQQQSAVFKQLHVDVAKNYTQMQLLGAVMDGFKAQADGPAKAAEAMALFGEAGAQLIPFLDLGSSGMAKLNEVTRLYGVANEDAAQKSAALGEAFDENNVALNGLGEALAQEFAPALTVTVQGVNSLIASWIDAYRRGGDVKTILDALDVAFKDLVALVADLGIAFDEGFQAIKLVVGGFGDAWRLVVDDAKGLAEELGDSFVALGRLIYDALTSNILNAARDMQSAEDKMATGVAATSARIRSDMALIGKDAAPDWSKMQGDFAAYIKFVNDLGAGKPAPQPIKPASDSGAPPGASATGARQPKGDKSQMEAWEADLRNAEAASREHTGAWLADMQAFELQFWQGKLATADKSSKDYQQVVAKVDELTLATHRSAGERQLSDDKKTIEAKKGNWADELAALQQYVADATKLSGGANTTGGKEAATVEADAIKENVKASIEAQIKGFDELAQAQQKQATEAVATARSSTDAQLAALKQLYDLGQVGAQSYFSQVRALRRQDTAQQVAALRGQLAEINANYAAESAMKGMTVEQAIALDDKYLAARMAVERRIAAATEAGNRQWTADTNAAILKIKSQFDGFVDPMVSGFSSGLLKMAEGGETFRKMMLQIGRQMLEDFVNNVVDKQVEKWLWGVTAQVVASTQGQAVMTALGMKDLAQSIANTTRKTTAALTGNQMVAASNTATQSSGLGTFIAQTAQMIALDAKKVFGGIFAAFSSNPVTLPAAAPAAAAGAAAVMSFSAAGGFDIPAGVNPLTQLHSQEMVLPATLANPMRSFFGSGPGSTAAVAGGYGGGASGGVGDAHLHYSPTINAPQQKSLKQMLDEQGADMISFVQAAVRNRSLKFA